MPYLPTAGISIAHNPCLGTNIPRIYILGDVKCPLAFTHTSYNSHILHSNLLNHASPPLMVTNRLISYVVCTEP